MATKKLTPKEWACPRCQTPQGGQCRQYSKANGCPQYNLQPPKPTLAAHVNKQAHYARFKIEPIDFSVANNLGYREGNIIKYVCRYPFKGQALSDLYKAKDYLERIIKDVEVKEAAEAEPAPYATAKPVSEQVFRWHQRGDKRPWRPGIT